MTSQPDKLFRDKLEDFQRPASVAAWERIESGLNKNQSKGVWMKFAAAFLLLAVAAYFLWPTTPTENSQPLTNVKLTPELQLVEKTNIEKIIPATTEESQERIAPKNNPIEKDNPILIADSKQPAIENNGTPVVTGKEIITTTEVAVVEVIAIEETSSRTIVYSAEEVNARFLRKKSSDEATTDEKKTSGLQKLMGLAYTLKNPDNGLGDLRQKKDEILALNFLSKEDKTNKEKN